MKNEFKKDSPMPPSNASGRPLYLCLRADQTRMLSQVQRANTFGSRLKGLLGRSALSEEAGLLIEPCNSVHTLGMRFSIGVIFLTAEHQILKIIEELPPGRLSPIVRGAKKVLELHPQRLSEQLEQGLEVGQTLSFEAADV